LNESEVAESFEVKSGAAEAFVFGALFVESGVGNESGICALGEGLEGALIGGEGFGEVLDLGIETVEVHAGGGESTGEEKARGMEVPDGGISIFRRGILGGAEFSSHVDFPRETGIILPRWEVVGADVELAATTGAIAKSEVESGEEGGAGLRYGGVGFLNPKSDTAEARVGG
jgi:hypothetical protein